MIASRRWALRVAVAIAALWPAVAAADPTTPADMTRAEALFQEGKRLMEEGDLARACERLAASEAIEPTVSSLGLLAGCHEEQGRIASAWKEYRATAQRAQAASDDRGAFALARAAALEPRLPRLLIRVKQPLPSLAILRNLERVAPQEIGVEVPVDPGAYEIVAKAPSMQEHRVTVTAVEGQQIVVEVPELLPVGAARPARPPKPRPAPIQRAATPPAPGGLRPEQAGALIAGGVGLVGAGVGIAFTASAISKNNESEAIRGLCTTREACAAGSELREGAYDASTAATVGLAIGAAGIVTSVVLLLLPEGAPATPRPQTGTLRIAPIAGAELGGAVITGDF